MAIEWIMGAGRAPEDHGQNGGGELGAYLAGYPSQGLQSNAEYGRRDGECDC